MIGILLAIGVLVAVFVGVNIGGSSTGVAFGPATGSGVLTMRQASLLMAVFVILGGFTVGLNVVKTLGKDFVDPQFFTIGASIGVLLFTGIGILLGNILKVSVSTSETAVGAVVGMGAALGVLDWSTVGIVVILWIVSAIISFWVAAVIGRYFYDEIAAKLDFGSDGRDLLGKVLLVGIGCYMAFSAGASNVANAVAPLVGSNQLTLTTGVGLGALAIGLGAFVLGPRTMKTVGEDITDLPREAALIVELIAATVITGLSWAGIPASLAVTATMCVIGLGWGRASREESLQKTLRPDVESDDWDDEKRLDLYNGDVTKRIIVTWITTPAVASILSFITFTLATRFGLLGL